MQATRYALTSEEEVIHTALMILERRLGEPRHTLTAPDETRRFLTLQMQGLEHEVFGILYLDTRNRIIASEHLFRGTLDGANVYPREVVKAALRTNAAGVIFYHNHPSGVAEPSDADRRLTTRLKDALALVEIRVLDHIVVGGTTTVSFVERGLL
jgi:DNA repair protein RadC